MKLFFQIGYNQAVSRITGLSRVTVSLWVCSGTFPEMSTRPPERGLLAPWREWLKEQRESGNFGAWLQGWQLMLRLYVRQSAVAGIMGVVESHVNRLKMLKGQMYGRAGFVLLRQRVMSPLA